MYIYDLIEFEVNDHGNS